MAAHQEVTEEWWNDHRHEFDLYTSAFAREEAAEGNPELATARLALLDSVPVLPTKEKVEDLAGKLLEGGLIPAKAATDAFHIVMAAVHGMDFLLTWNCTHNHNLSIIRRVDDCRGIRGGAEEDVLEKFAAMTAFLASDHAQNITGQTINIDSGHVMHS